MMTLICRPRDAIQSYYHAGAADPYQSDPKP